MVGTDQSVANNLRGALREICIVLAVLGVVVCGVLGLAQHMLTWLQITLSVGGLGMLGVGSRIHRNLRSRPGQTDLPGQAE